MHTCSTKRPETAAAGVAGAVSMTVLAVAFGLLALGFEWFWIAFPIGYGAVLPLSVQYARRKKSEPVTDADEPTDPLTRLKERYVAGEIDEQQFERELDEHIGRTSGE